jgi:hypothetical protein
MDMSQEQIPQPPQPKEQKRSLRFYSYQVIGIPLLFLVPILAVFGVFGETTTMLNSSNGGIELEVKYTNRVLFQGLDGTEIAVRNTSEEVLEMVIISIDKAFLDAYSDVDISPDVSVITEEAYLVELSQLQPGQTQFVTIDSRGRLIGNHQGTIRATANDLSTSVTLEVFIIP